MSGLSWQKAEVAKDWPPGSVVLVRIDQGENEPIYRLEHRWRTVWGALPDRFRFLLIEKRYIETVPNPMQYGLDNTKIAE